jgi:predicted small secreted protein
LGIGNRKDPMMKQIFPVVLALIPLAAVVSACVTCP